MNTTWRSTAVIVIVAAVLLIFALSFRKITSLPFSDVVYTPIVSSSLSMRVDEDGKLQPIEDEFYPTPTRFTREAALPLFVGLSFQLIQIEANLELGSIHSTIFHLLPDDCLNALEVNGKRVVLDDIPFCDWRNGRSLDLSAYLRKGQNRIRFLLKNQEGQGSLSVSASPSDPLVQMNHTVEVLSYFFLITVIIALFRPPKSVQSLLWLFAIGAAMRQLYFYVTPFYERAYDYSGHIEYLEYVLKNSAIPPYDMGWQSYQPPLYYFLCAGWVEFWQSIGFDFYSVDVLAQSFSLFLTQCTFAIGLYWVYLAFPEQKDRHYALVMGGSWSVFPSLVFITTRVSNDVLIYCLSVMCCVALAQFWRSPKSLYWLIALVCLVAALLTKSNAAFLFPIFACLLLLQSKLSLKKRFSLAFLSLLCIVVTSYSYHQKRFAEEGQPDLVGNIEQNHPGLRVANTLDTFLTFNPFAMVSLPFNHTWDDRFRRKNFWEFFYRSVFYGEFGMGGGSRLLSSSLLLLGVLLIPVCVFGLWKSVHRSFWDDLPLLLTAGAAMSSLIAVRAYHNIAGFADFRYIPVFLLPVGFYLARGMSGLSRSGQQVVKYTVAALLYGLAFLTLSFYFLSSQPY